MVCFDKMDEVNDNGHAQLLDDEITFNDHNGNEASLKAKRVTSSTGR
jgi:hypothetical protein